MKVLCLIVLLTVAVCASPFGLDETMKKKLKLRSSMQVNPFEVKDDKASEGAAPYLVSVSVSSIAYAHYCAATIVGKEWLLAAAHCIKDLEGFVGVVTGLPVYAGLTDRNNLAGVQVRIIDFVFVHKEFTDLKGADNVAMLHVTPGFKFNERVKQIALPYKNEVYDAETGATYGWSLNCSDSLTYSSLLQVDKSSILSREECRKSLPSDVALTKKHICLKISSCFDDDGTPLVVERPGSVVELAGISSLDYLPCSNKSNLKVYTAVSQYVAWIAEVQWAYYILH